MRVKFERGKLIRHPLMVFGYQMNEELPKAAPKSFCCGKFSRDSSSLFCFVHSRAIRALPTVSVNSHLPAEALIDITSV